MHFLTGWLAQEERVKRMELEKQRNAAIMIAHWWGRYQFKKRQITDVGFLLSLRSMMQPWVHRARGVVRVRCFVLVFSFTI